MADDIVIRAEGLGKKYVIGHEAQRERYVALRDVIARGARNAWRKAADMAKGRIVVPGDMVEEFWALKDVSFEVKRGEVLGIIGRNGAGKSTLLKILSRITEPTEGRVTIKGRVASLLEVGTGFHPELSGRENIFLNGAVLGMTRAEIKRKFDEIVAFSEVEKFLDTPVKRYSSGMYVRLAFAVAAHLEPEILIVDEVLAVGDAEFQKKCLGKMQDVAGHGRTVLFVSHNMAAIRGLCKRSLLLEGGSLTLDNTPEMVTARYLMSHSASGEVFWETDPPSAEGLRLRRVSVRNASGNIAGRIACNESFSLVVEYEIRHKVREPRVGFVLKTADDVILCGSATTDMPSPAILDGGCFQAIATFPNNPFNSGTYYAQFGLSLPPHIASAILTDYVLSFSMEDLEGSDIERRASPGLLRPPIKWDHNVLSDMRDTPND
jgi:lipopolysaccharide transport system ATP-binding protein